MSVELMGVVVLWVAVTALVYAGFSNDYSALFESNRAHGISRATHGLTALSDFGLVLDSAVWTLDAPRLTAPRATHVTVNYTANASLLIVELPDAHTASKQFVCSSDFFERMPANAQGVWRQANGTCVTGRAA